MTEAVLFDMDGVLLDSEKIYIACWVKAGQALGLEFQYENALELRSLERPSAIKSFEKWYGDGSWWKKVYDKRVEFMAEELKKNPIELKPYAVETLNALKERGYKTALVTATDYETAIKRVKDAGLFDYLDEIVSAKSVEHGKPYPDPYLFACEKIGVKPENTIAVEDSPNGVRSASSAGCKTVMVPDLTEPDEELSKLLYAKCKDLSGLINLV
ncbi:MAG: HAD family phosphatase [Lachnospiraceae bacterium]|nr:HAD family phosphatase [Lachnospiraceae bacterium]